MSHSGIRHYGIIALLGLGALFGFSRAAASIHGHPHCGFAHHRAATAHCGYAEGAAACP